MLKLAKIKQSFPSFAIPSPEKELAATLNDGTFTRAIAGRKKVAIAVGSRGIANLPALVGAIVRSVRSTGAEAFIIPAMGSHGLATATGQEMVLAKLGITRDTVGAEIVSSMDVISLGQVQMDGRRFEAFVDKAAWELADALILVNRIKQHTAFIGKFESGLVKMATIGLGNHKGAEQVHSLGTRGLRELMPALAEVTLANEKIIGGLGIIEDACHETAALHWIDREEIMRREPLLLDQAKSLMPRLPIDRIDFLLVRQIGKDISGAGLDTKVIGRLMITGEEEPPLPQIELIGICDITDASYGNALGIGLGDFITKHAVRKIDFDALKKNILTSTFYQRAKTPMVLDDEREMVDVAVRHFQKLGRERPRVVFIRDTLNLSDIYVSESVLDEIAGRDDISVISGAEEVAFDADGRIIVEF